MSAAALNLLMMNCSRHHEAALDPRHPGVSAPGPAHGPAAGYQPPHPDYPPSYPHLLQYARQDTPAPVCQLKRLHPGATNTATELLRCQRRRTQLPGPSPCPPSPGPPPYGRFAPVLHRQVSSVARRNERERNRVRLVNHGFALLQQHVPAPAARSRRMSKVDTLKAAVGYIRQLRAVLQRADHALLQPASPASPPPSPSPSPSPPQAAAAGGAATPAPAPLPLHRRLYPQCGSMSPSSSSSSSSSEEGSSRLDADTAVASAGEFSGSGSDAETSLLRDDHGSEDGGATEMAELVDFASWFC